MKVKWFFHYMNKLIDKLHKLQNSLNPYLLEIMMRKGTLDWDGNEKALRCEPEHLCLYTALDNL